MGDAKTFHTIDSTNCNQFDDGTWENATEKKFDECRKQAPRKNMHDGKFVKNASKTKPYCVRCKPTIDNTSSVKQLIAQLEKLVDMLGGKTTSYSPEHMERLRMMDKLEQARALFADKMHTDNGDNAPLGPSHIKVPKRGCLEPTEGKSEDQLYRFSRKGEKGHFCGSLRDKEVRASKDYHHLQELDNLHSKKGVSWPVTPTGRSLRTHEVYDRAALCSQLKNEEECKNDKDRYLPLALEKGKASDLCKWNPDVNDGNHRGTCEPDLPNMDDTNDEMGRWLHDFKKEEQKMLNNGGKSNASIRWNRHG